MLLLSLLACNSYELFRLTGYEQANFSNDADILFVIDSSPTMEDDAEEISLNFPAFINKLTSSEGADVPQATLADALSNYLRETSGESLFIDYQLGLTTHTMHWTEGGTSEIDPGEAGTLVGETITRESENPGAAFQEQLLCTATGWNEADVPSNPDYVCDEEAPAAPEADGGAVTSEYLDCLCGPGEWKGHVGSGTEPTIEAAAIALCRALPEPPADCYEIIENAPQAFQEGDEQTNIGLLREDAQVLVVIITDEGDQSLRGIDGVGETDISAYTDLFADMGKIVRFVVIGPALEDDGSLICNEGGATVYGLERLYNIVEETAGTYIPMFDTSDPACPATDYGQNLEKVGELLNTRITVFPLQQVPDTATIDVWVDNEQVDTAPLESGDEDVGTAEYGSGWSYSAALNAVEFHGDAIPGFNEDVRIYYVPLSGNPREIPF